MQESLICSVCEKTWKRNKTRGRKPTVCTKCLKSSIQASNSKPKQPNQKSEPKINIPDNNLNSDKKTLELTPRHVYSSLYPRDPLSKEIAESTKNGSTWKCKGCGNIMRLDLSITAVPTHKCSPNSSKINLYERIG